MQLTKNATKKSFFLLLQINFSFLLIFSKVYVYIFWMAWQEVWLSYLVVACPFQYYGLLGLHGHGQCYFWGHHCYCPSRQCWLLTQHHCLGQKKITQNVMFLYFLFKNWLDIIYEPNLPLSSVFNNVPLRNVCESTIPVRKHLVDAKWYILANFSALCLMFFSHIVRVHA